MPGMERKTVIQALVGIVLGVVVIAGLLAVLIR